MKNIEITDENYDAYKELNAIKDGDIPNKYRAFGLELFIFSFLLFMIGAGALTFLGNNIAIVVYSILAGIFMETMNEKLPKILAVRNLKKRYPNLNTKIKKEDLQKQLEKIQNKGKINELKQELEKSKENLKSLKQEDHIPACVLENEKSLEKINEKLEEIEKKRSPLIQAKEYLETIKNEEDRYQKLMSEYEQAVSEKTPVLQKNLNIENK